MQSKINQKKKEVLTQYILPAFLKYKYKEIYDISIYQNELIRVKYNNHFFYIDIIYSYNNFYWKLTPYKNSYYTTEITSNSFERVLFAITEAK